MTESLRTRWPDRDGAADRAAVDLYAANAPARFWKLLLDRPVTAEAWRAASRVAAHLLPNDARRLAGEDGIVADVLGEGQFGPGHWRLSLPKRAYYELKPLLPRQLTVGLRRHYHRHRGETFPLGWPVEDRFVTYQLHLVAALLESCGLAGAPFVHFWPDAHRFALVLTHDVEDAPGHAFVGRVAELEERLGYRSVFNFVPERYPVDQGLLADLRARGFEIGVHGLKHDGKLFSSRRRFETRARRINEYLRAWGAVGFRSPLTHRHPEWMQALEIEYDTSFFDTDPYEVIPGGTMSIWPFFLGHFVELPYTLAQDHTLLVLLRAGGPALWLEKVAFLARRHGMALINTHPDYLREGDRLAMYGAFLEALRERGHFWHALPRDVARWWRRRDAFRPAAGHGHDRLRTLPGATLARVEYDAAGVELVICPEPAVGVPPGHGRVPPPALPILVPPNTERGTLLGDHGGAPPSPG